MPDELSTPQSSPETPKTGSNNAPTTAAPMFDEKWLENFYKECGREVTLAYTTLNQMKNWAIVTAAAAISGLAFGTAAGKFPSVPMFTGTVIVYAFVLRFFIRAIICYINLIRWNTLQKDCIELKLFLNPTTALTTSEREQAEKKLETHIQNYYHRWLSPLTRKSQLIQNLKLGFMLLFTLVLFFLIWGFAALRNEPLVRGLGFWALGITILEFYDFTHDRAFDDVKSNERRKTRGDEHRIFPVPESRGWYLAKWTFVLALSIGIAVWSQKRQMPSQRHWLETATETIYTERYSNCDYGYNIILPNRLVAHREKSPNPNHGFRVDLSAPERTEAITGSAERSVWVWSEYSSSESSSLDDVVEHQMGIQEQGKDGFKIVEQKPFKLSGLSAVYIRAEFRRATSTLVEEDVIAYRSEQNSLRGIVYMLSLVTPAATYGQDKQTFADVVNGFRLTDIPIEKCPND
jgi:hypothetical protein